MRPSQALALNRDTVLRILAHYPVKNPKVFGSVARGDDTEESDLDILVEHEGGLSYFDIFRLEDALADALGVRVSVHTPAEFGPRSTHRINRDLRIL